MKLLRVSVVCLAACTAALAQQWEFGGVGGGGFLSSVPVNSPSGSARAGFQDGAAFGAFVGQSLGSHLTGEIRYEHLQNNLQLTSGGQTARFSGYAHAVHYDLLWHTNRKNSKVQFFAAVGGGVKIFQGTGTEAAYQPLSQFGYFTKTRAFKPMVSVGAGMTVALSQRMFLRSEFRDFMTMFPTEIITPPNGAHYGSLLHDIVPLIGLDYIF